MHPTIRPTVHPRPTLPQHCLILGLELNVHRSRFRIRWLELDDCGGVVQGCGEVSERGSSLCAPVQRLDVRRLQRQRRGAVVDARRKLAEPELRERAVGEEGDARGGGEVGRGEGARVRADRLVQRASLERRVPSRLERGGRVLHCRAKKKRAAVECV